MQHSVNTVTADGIIRLLSLKPHPEGGHFVETFRDAAGVGGRAASTAIYFLLARGERSHWHRVDAAEVWHWYAGAPLKLEIADRDDGPIRRAATLIACHDVAPQLGFQINEREGVIVVALLTGHFRVVFSQARVGLTPSGHDPGAIHVLAGHGSL